MASWVGNVCPENRGDRYHTLRCKIQPRRPTKGNCRWLSLVRHWQSLAHVRKWPESGVRSRTFMACLRRHGTDNYPVTARYLKHKRGHLNFVLSCRYVEGRICECSLLEVKRKRPNVAQRGKMLYPACFGAGGLHSIWAHCFTETPTRVVTDIRTRQRSHSKGWGHIKSAR